MWVSYIDFSGQLHAPAALNLGTSHGTFWMTAGLDASEKINIFYTYNNNICLLQLGCYPVAVGTKSRFLARPAHSVVNIQTAPVSEVDANERFIKKLKQTEVRECFLSFGAELCLPVCFLSSFCVGCLDIQLKVTSSAHNLVLPGDSGVY